MMSLEEYTNEVKAGLRKRLKAAPKLELEKYLMALEKRGHIKASYESDVNRDPKILELTGMTAEPNPSAYCYAVAFQYPDFPA